MAGQHTRRLGLFRRGHCFPAGPTREELLADNHALRAQVAALEEINAALREEVAAAAPLAAGVELLTPATVVDEHKALARTPRAWDTDVYVMEHQDVRPINPTHPCDYRGALDVPAAHQVMREHLECPTDIHRCPVRVTARDTLRAAGRMTAPTVAV